MAFVAERVPYFVGRTRELPSQLPGMALWRERISVVMQRNATGAADARHLPPAQVVAISSGAEA